MVNNDYRPIANPQGFSIFNSGIPRYLGGKIGIPGAG